MACFNEEGRIFALPNDKFNFLNWLLLTLGLIFAHATNNMLNDFTDHIKNVDKDNYFRADGHEGIFQVCGHHGDPRPSNTFFVLFYTYPLKYIGLGEFAVFIVW
jgi:1,4-dihydroxy-2-naphthoate octaprenyltransferase